MMRASELYGRAVIDLDTAERIGQVDEIIVDPYGPGIAGYVIACDRSLFSTKKRIIIPIEAFHAIGPDALTMRSVGAPDYHTAHLDALPRLSELTGRRMVSFGGRLLGSVEDALISERDGRIIGYPIDRPSTTAWLDTVFGLGWRSDRPDYVRADAALRIGARLIVVPDDAVAAGSDLPEDDLSGAARPEPTFASAPPSARELPEPSTASERAAPAPSAAEVRAAQSRTTPFDLGEILVTDERLGLEPTAERDRDDDQARPAVDPEQDTGLISAGSGNQTRSRRRAQAERMR